MSNYCVVCENQEVLTNKRTGEELEYCSKKCRKVAVKSGLLKACVNCGIYPKLLEYGNLHEYCDDDCKLELNKNKSSFTQKRKTTQKKSKNQERRQDSGYGDDDDDLPPAYDTLNGLNISQNNNSSSPFYANEFYTPVPTASAVPDIATVAPTPQIIFVQPPPQVIHIHHNVPPQAYVNQNPPHNIQNGGKQPSTMKTVAKVGAKVGAQIAMSIITGGLSDLISG
ncbi:17495_t:CDS:2 [Funneliformis geosporum]|uniref:11519_t:CDS:1 n=1 Tax=Funneliformis geosporum TaxID=1117311 RepID=A0A9W4SWN7_9GLOM|nr:11519_t:CDS:2 [Funneliformis geosporum]CAI2185024.1 17495_t:CDS:2 [Funneliformis geosporum]